MRLDEKKLKDAENLKVEKFVQDGDWVGAEVEGRGGIYCPSVDFFREESLLQLHGREDPWVLQTSYSSSSGAGKKRVGQRKAGGGD